MQSNCLSFLYITVLWRVVPDYAINNHLTPFISMQNHYNLAYREEEREMFPTLKVGFLPRWCLKSGWLVWTYLRLDNIHSTSAWGPSHGLRSVEAC